MVHCISAFDRSTFLKILIRTIFFNLINGFYSLIKACDARETLTNENLNTLFTTNLTVTTIAIINTVKQRQTFRKTSTNEVVGKLYHFGKQIKLKNIVMFW